ncbi:TadE/TadG family type IV pilus assembly protein [Homoserinibacter sp. GY 40078]|uniref:TadE/TadG family type IV pilus assembly protein n=1 Tax=Homoserinibacter sp. GY 40078 TaxID=2603275 RepID=UPI0011CC88F0|nr:TadE family protein [Homoserinibacter sp. GY 40078]TXK19790.1 pilus assembly protein [Homoserinibacter sp. GY 40078]
MGITTRWRDDRGSAPAEFVFVGALLTGVALAVLQLTLALHVRTTVLDAAAEGARYGSLADKSPHDARARAAELITAAIGEQYAAHITVEEERWRDHSAVVVRVEAPLPLLGLLGPDRVIEVEGHAIREHLD